MNKIPFIIFLILVCSAPVNAQTAREILQNMEDAMRGDAAETEMTMKVVRPRYTRETSMKSWSLGEDFSMILVTAPARDRGTAYLKRNNEMWNYVPNIDRTIKMPPSMMSQSWMGSDFTNDDLVRGTSVIDDYENKRLDDETVDGQECFKIEMIPHPETPVPYEKVIRWVRKSDYLPVKAVNYNELGEAVSTINFKNIKELDGRKFPTEMEMIPEDKEGHKTIIITHKADFSPDLSESFFSQQNLTRIR